MHPLFSKFSSIYLVLAFVVSCGAFLSAGWLQPDEHARVIEIAGYLVRGFGSLAWEFDSNFPIVSMFLGAVHAPALWLAERVLHLEPLAQAGFVRLFSGLVCLSRVWAFSLILRHLGIRRHIGYTVFFALTPYCLPFLARTSQENWGASAFLWALYAFVWIGGKRAWAASMLFGALLALSITFRLQMGPSALALAVAFAFVTNPRNLLYAFLGGALGLLPMALVDYWITGVPFKPAYNYLLYALSNEEGGELWGTSPWYFYFKAYLSAWFPPFGLVFVPFMILGFIRFWPLAIAFCPFLLVHTVLGHKELRYFSPMLPVMALAMIVGWEHRVGLCQYFAFLRGGWVDATVWRWRKGFRRLLMIYAGGLIFVGIGLTLAVQNPSPFLYDELARMKKSGRLSSNFVYVANSLSNVSQFYFPFPDALPPKIGFDEFWGRFTAMSSGGEKLTTHYAIYRMDIEKFAQIEAKCEIKFISIGPFYRAVLRKLAPILRAKDVDGIVHCP